MSTALLVARLVFGLGIAAHGVQKLFGWFDGYGLAGTAQFFEILGLRPGRVFAITAGLGETVGGALLVFGLLGPVGPALIMVVMIVAAIAVHAKNGFFVTNNGVEVPTLYAMGAFVLAFAGPGAYSCDRMLGLLWLSNAGTAWIAVGAALAGAGLNLAARRAPAPPPPAPGIGRT
jgi:putative oxidoreductase